MIRSNKHLKSKYLRTDRYFIILSIFTLLYTNAFSQEVQFSLFDNAPLLLNPANTGNFWGDWRISGIYRNQATHTKPYSSAYIGFDRSFYIFKQKIGAGLYFLNDNAGEGKLSHNKLYASMAYAREISNNHISIGFQAGFVYGSIKNWDIYNPETGIHDLENPDPDFQGDISYLDINAGISWKRSILIFEPEAGFAVNHINKSKNSFIGSEDQRETLKTLLYTRIKTKFNDRIYIVPKFLLSMKDASSVTILGTDLGYNLQGNLSTVKNIYIGAYIRDGLANEINSFSLVLGTTVSRMGIGISYDTNLSEFGKDMGSMGAFEISFIYRSISTVLNSYSIPCERY